LCTESVDLPSPQMTKNLFFKDCASRSKTGTR